MYVIPRVVQVGSFAHATVRYMHACKDKIWCKIFRKYVAIAFEGKGDDKTFWSLAKYLLNSFR